ncbi:MAG TPA: hypothetical protein VE987_05245 [Polyangiaceae bacterium]|nr:hypothetical protein [Polyangiaceae bacterium]
MENRVFFPQTALDRWVLDGRVDLQQNEVTLLQGRRRYRLVDAVRVLREVGGGADSHGLVGRVKPRAALEQLGAEIVETSMLLGDAAFDVEPGWLGVPTAPFAEYAATEGRAAPGSPGPVDLPTSDEDLLARFAAPDA